MSQSFTKSQPLDTDGTLAANSDYIAPSEKAVKTYADTKLSSVSWGIITGTLSSQTDLQAALDTKVPTTRTITATAPITIDGTTSADLSANRTIAHSTANGYLHIPASGATTQILQWSSAGTAKWVSVSSDLSFADGGAATIANAAVTLAKMANMATASLIYRKTAGAGAPEVNTLATLKTDLAYTAADVGAVPTTRTISTTAPLSGGGDLSANRTLTIDAATASAAGSMSAADFQSLRDGWIPVSDSWSYASATTITVPSGATSIYNVGDKIKLTQTTVKYFYVVAVASTLLTVTGGSDYTVANAAISAISYSKVNNPLNFPHWFNYTPTGVSASNVSMVGKFALVGRLCAVEMKIAFGGAITFTTHPTLPITASMSVFTGATTLGFCGSGEYYDSSATTHFPFGIIPSVVKSATVVTLYIQATGLAISTTTPVTWANGDIIMQYFSYEI